MPGAAGAECFGDLDGDFNVGAGDLSVMLSDWGSNASPAEAQNELEGTPAEITANFFLNTVDTPATADGSGAVTLDLVAFTISLNGLVTAGGMELVPGGEATLTEADEECTAIALAPDSEAISFDVVAP